MLLLNDSLACLRSVSKLFSAWMRFYECSPLFLVLTLMMQMRWVAQLVFAACVILWSLGYLDINARLFVLTALQVVLTEDTHVTCRRCLQIRVSSFSLSFAYISLEMRRINHSTFNLYKIQERSVIKHILELYMQNIWLYATVPE